MEEKSKRSLQQNKTTIKKNSKQALQRPRPLEVLLVALLDELLEVERVLHTVLRERERVWEQSLAPRHQTLEAHRDVA